MAFTEPRRLAEDDALEDFSCGNEFVDGWLHRHARGAYKTGTAVVYVTKDAGDGAVAGFYTLSMHSVARAEVSGGWSKRNVPESIPVVLLGMLGVDRRFQGAGLGADLVRDAIGRAEAARGVIGSRALVVDPYDDVARAFYHGLGFDPIPGTKRMYFPLGRVE